MEDLFPVELDQAKSQNRLGFDLSGIDDGSFWDGVEQLILNALSNYSDKAESSADQKRLFAEDASKGLRSLTYVESALTCVNEPTFWTG